MVINILCLNWNLNKLWLTVSLQRTAFVQYSIACLLCIFPDADHYSALLAKTIPLNICGLTLLAISLCCTISSLEETYEALKTFKVLGIEKKHDITTSSCASVAHTLKSTSSASKDYFHALRVNSILKCDLNSEAFRVLKIFLPSATIV